MSGKWIIVIIIVLGILSLTLNDREGGFSLNLGAPYGSGNARLSQPVDANRDGVVSEAERQAELKRIERELERVEETLAEALAAERASPYKDQVVLESGSARDSDYHDEYVIVRTKPSNISPVTITGWHLMSPITGTRATIGSAAHLPTGNWRNETLSPIILDPGARVIIATRSFIGKTSFRTNLCTGYFDQNINIRPRLRRDCPALEDESLALHGIVFSAFNEEEDYDMCLDAIDRVPRCTETSPRLSFMDEDDEELCEDFIRENTTYERCVSLHRNDFDFLGDEWRVFIGVGEDLWRDQREVIILTDENGKTVDVVSY
ncbi:hypothetical protein L0Y40_01340 [Candidatus Wolfebacteria bacterium]|nr:hypothetical protein [Candidatus Wolfebacteria bacterium]